MGAKDERDTAILYTGGLLIGGAFIVKAAAPLLAFAGITVGLGIPLALYGAGMTMISYHALSKSKHTRVFKECGLYSQSGAMPMLKGKKETDYSKIYYYTLPAGLCLKNFVDKQDAIEQFIGREVDLRYEYKMLIIEEYMTNLKTHIPYVPVDIEGDLPILVGYNRAGQVVSADLSVGEPHVLVAGETGGGKSTLLRATITNLLLKTSAQLYLIDLKGGTEFNIFQRCASVKAFCRHINDARVLLEELVQETRRRQEMFYDEGVKDIKGHNKMRGVERLPYSVIVIDEYADLQYNKEIAQLVEELGRKARACGVHMILSTQYPTVQVINNAIKCNVTNVIGLKTLNTVTSNVIIGDSGLEKLRGKGHGKFKRSGQIVEFQAAFLDSDLCVKLIEHLYIDKHQQKTTEPTDWAELEVFKS
jgi:S-DNA-T family DNA segregation ATPase FtsK/SpoIIIE